MHILIDSVSIKLDGKPLHKPTGEPVALPTLKKAKIEAARLNDLAAKGFIAPGYYSVGEV